MALFTAAALSDKFEPTIMAPAGPVHEEGRRLGFKTVQFGSPEDFAFRLRPILARSERLAFLATGVVQSAACLFWAGIYRRPVTHLHLVHGGANEKLSYARKKRMNGMKVKLVAVSRYVKDRLVVNGTRAQQVEVIENFIPAQSVNQARRHPAFTSSGIRRVAVLSRLDPEKRVDVLIDAIEKNPDLKDLEIHVFGSGWQADVLKERVAASRLNIHFEGFCADAGAQLSSFDLLVHLCPVEPFGLAILEAIAARVPVLVPDAGGAGSLVRDEIEGFQFHANDENSLADRLRTIRSRRPEVLNSIVSNAALLLESRFSESARIADYRKLLLEPVK